MQKREENKNEQINIRTDEESSRRESEHGTNEWTGERGTQKKRTKGINRSSKNNAKEERT